MWGGEARAVQNTPFGNTKSQIWSQTARDMPLSCPWIYRSPESRREPPGQASHFLEFNQQNDPPLSKKSAASFPRVPPLDPTTLRLRHPEPDEKTILSSRGAKRYKNVYHAKEDARDHLKIILFRLRQSPVIASSCGWSSVDLHSPQLCLQKLLLTIRLLTIEESVIILSFQ